MSDENKTFEDDPSMVEVVTFVDDEGNEFEMEIILEFDHKDKSYALLAEFIDPEDHVHDENCDHDHSQSLYIFEVVSNPEGEDFLSIDDDELMDELSERVDVLLSEFDDEEE